MKLKEAFTKQVKNSENIQHVSGVAMIGIIAITSESALVDPEDFPSDGKALKVVPHSF